MASHRTMTLIPGVARAVGAVVALDKQADLTAALVEQQTRALTAALVEQLEAAIWLIATHAPHDAPGTIEIANGAARRLGETLLARDVTGGITGVGGRPLREILSGGPHAWEARTGAAVHELRAHLTSFEGTTRVTVVATDVTRERATLARLHDAERRAAVGVLGAGVAHEINNPLGFVLANVQALAEYLEELGRFAGDHPGAREILEDAPALVAETQEGLGRIRAIVHDLLCFSVEGGAEEPHVPLTLSGVVDQALRLAGHELRRRAHLEREDRSSPVLRGQAGALSDVVLDLLRNAVDAVGPLADAARRVVIVRTGGEGGRAVLEVEDRGVGIPPHVVPRVFDPFFSTKANRQGTGLGLSVASEIVRRHGGAIHVSSREGVGTLVRVELPSS